MNILKEIRGIERRMQRLLTWRDPRMVVGHPDLCLYLSNMPYFEWRYLIKRGAKKGHLCVAFGWVRATIAW